MTRLMSDEVDKLQDYSIWTGANLSYLFLFFLCGYNTLQNCLWLHPYTEFLTNLPVSPQHQLFPAVSIERDYFTYPGSWGCVFRRGGFFFAELREDRDASAQDGLQYQHTSLLACSGTDWGHMLQDQVLTKSLPWGFCCFPWLCQPRKWYAIECIILLSGSGWNDLF